MALVKIKSENPDFSFIIKKNPQNPIMKNIRKGTAIGFYTYKENKFENEYNIFFKDSIEEVSYPSKEESDFEYLNTTRFTSPIFVINSISDFLSYNLKNLDEKDIETDCSFYINSVYVNNIKLLNQFQKYYEDFILEIELIEAKVYSINIKTNNSIFMLLNYVNLLFLFITMISKENFEIFTENNLEKYIKSINKLNSPFFIRYLFSKNFLNSKKKFFNYKTELEKTDKLNINLKYGNTALQRKEDITPILSFENSIIDLGCGEGIYSVEYSKKININKVIYSIDIDKKCLETLNKKISKLQIENINILNNINEFKNDSNEVIDVLCTEVIEHLEIKDSEELINYVLENISINKFILTTPNKEFNKFYMLEENEFRHDDHKWEMTKNEFNIFINNICKNKNLNLDFFDIGDEVNGISTSIGVVITKK